MASEPVLTPLLPHFRMGQARPALARGACPSRHPVARSRVSESPRACRTPWAAPSFPRPRPGRAPGTLNLRPPFTNRGGEQIPRSQIARSATTVRVLGRGTPSKHVTAREKRRRWEGQPAEKRRDGATEAPAGWRGAWGPVAVDRPPATVRRKGGRATARPRF